MRFAIPWMLVWLALVPALAALLGVSFALRRRQLERFASAGLLPRLLLGASTGRLAGVGTLRVAAVGLIVLALARPQWGRRDEPIVRRGVDVVLALDLSASMLAEDVSPNRLEQARAEAISLVGSLTGDRVALVTFGGRAAAICPLTADYGAVRLFLDAADASFAPGAGTDLGRAIEEASRIMNASVAEKRYKTLVLLTDGEDLEGTGMDAVRKARESGIVVHAIGVGSPQGGPIPLRDDRGVLTGYKLDRQGKVVTTRFDPNELEKIVLATDGVFLHAGPAGDAGAKVAEAISKMEKREISSRLATRFEDRYQLPLAVALVLLGIESAWMPWRRRARTAAAGASARPGGTRRIGVATAAVTLAALLALVSPGLAHADADRSGSERGAEAVVQGGTAQGTDGRDGGEDQSGASAPGNGSGADDGDSRESGAAGGKAGGNGASPGVVRGSEGSMPGGKGSAASGARGLLNAGKAPSSAVARTNREGNRLYQREHYPEALSKYESAGASSPDLPALRYNIGNALARQGKYGEAASEYQRALRNASPDLAPAVRYNLGNTQFLQGQYKDAAESYLKVLEKKPQDEAARRNLELALRALKQPDPQKQQSQDQKKDSDKKNDQQQQQQQQQQQEGKDQRDENRDGSGQQQPQPRDDKRKDSKKGGGRAAEQGKLDPKEAERLLDSLAEEEKKSLKQRLARQPREAGPEKDW